MLGQPHMKRQLAVVATFVIDTADQLMFGIASFGEGANRLKTNASSCHVSVSSRCGLSRAPTRLRHGSSGSADSESQKAAACGCGCPRAFERPTVGTRGNRTEALPNPDDFTPLSPSPMAYGFIERFQCKIVPFQVRYRISDALRQFETNGRTFAVKTHCLLKPSRAPCLCVTSAVLHQRILH